MLPNLGQGRRNTITQLLFSEKSDLNKSISFFYKSPSFNCKTQKSHHSETSVNTMKIAQRPQNLEARQALKMVASLCLGVFPSAALHAQSATTALADVMVQSGRLEQKQFDAPASVFSIDADTIHNSGPQVNISDVLNRAPGVVALNRNNYAQDVQISIRGFGSRAAFGVRGIRLITDGIPASMPDGQGQTSTISMTSTDRIEVLTGPLAQLYGNASGGVIQTFTREAGATPEAQVSLYTGSFGMQRTDWQISQRSGNVGLVADYSTFSIDGYRQQSSAERKQLNSVITVDAKPDTRFKFIVNIFDMPEAKDALGLRANQLATPSNADDGALTYRTRKTVKQEQTGAVIEHVVNSDLKFLGRVYGGMRSNLQYQVGTTTNPTGAWTGLEREFKGVGLQANGKALVFEGKRVTWTAGVDYDHAQEQRQAGAATNGEKSLSNGNALTRNELNSAINLDVFAQANWSINERYTLTTGVRRSDVTLKSRDDYPTTGPGSDADGSGRVQYKATSPVIGLTWHAKDNLNLYANYGKGFETPTLSEAAYKPNGNSTPLATFNPNLAASTSQHLELGTKWIASANTRLDASWFHIKTDNEIVTLRNSGGRTAFDNSSQTTRDGFEVALRHQLNKHWRSQTSATFLDASYDKGFRNFVTGTTNEVLAGNKLPAIPKRQLFTSLQWSEKGFAQVGQKPALGLEAGLDLIGRSSMWANDSNSTTTNDYALAAGFTQLNARVRQRFEIAQVRVEAFVGVDNITSKNNISSVISNQSSQKYFEPGLPRNWVVGLTSKIPL
jgi:iron complex outermembrane receptor protein